MDGIEERAAQPGSTTTHPQPKRRNLMRKIIFVFGLMLSAAGLAQAQSLDPPKVETFAGGGLMRDGATSGNTLYGGLQFEGNYNFRKHLGAVGDLSWEHRSLFGTGISQWHYLFGPGYSWRQERATLFGHVLFGGNTLRAAGGSTSGFAMGLAVASHYNPTPHTAIPRVQADS